MASTTIDEGMVVILGVTGAGKSTFVNTLHPGSVAVENGLQSTTQRPQAIQIFLDDERTRSVTVVDTPGFDDTYRTNAEVLTEITDYLTTQYTLKIPLRGIIYLHPIHENKMRGSGRQYLEMFQALCGDDALKNVLLVTTHWDTVEPNRMGETLRREQELLDRWWAPMIRKGSTAWQFDGNRITAEAMVLELVRQRGSVVLDIQRELVDGNKRLSDTTAGRPFGNELEEEIARHKKSVEEIDVKLAKASRRTRGNGDNGISAEVRRDLVEKRQDHVRQLEKLEVGQKQIKVKVGEKIRARIEDTRRNLFKKNGYMSSGITIFVAVVNIALSVVQLAL